MKRSMPHRHRLLALIAGALVSLALAPAGASAAEGSLQEWLSGSSFLATLTTHAEVGSTVPPNGDVNPYGIVNVTRSEGALVAGDTLISNFNNNENLQGTGTTLVELSPAGALSVFAQIDASKLPGPCPGGVGLTTALTILPGGYVVVGSLPTTNGQAATAQAGCLIVLDSTGHPVETISGPPINGPWDLTSIPGPVSKLYVTNVLNGTVAAEGATVDQGTVARIELLTGAGHAPVVTSKRVIANGFPERTDPAALVVGPTGVAVERLPFGLGNLLFVSDTVGNRIALVVETMHTIFGADDGFTIAKGGHLSSPLGMTLTPSGHVLTANAGDGNIVESTIAGRQFEPFDTGAGAGGLFGLTIGPEGHGVLYVNDTENTLELAN